MMKKKEEQRAFENAGLTNDEKTELVFKREEEER
jgi:hypothetical protein